MYYSPLPIPNSPPSSTSQIPRGTRGTWHAKTDFSHQQAPKCYFLNFDM